MIKMNYRHVLHCAIKLCRTVRKAAVGIHASSGSPAKWHIFSLRRTNYFVHFSKCIIDTALHQD